MKLRTICQIYSTSPIWPESKHSMCFDSGLAAINCDVPQDFFYFYYIWMTLIKHIANKISLNVKKTEMVIFKSVLGKMPPPTTPPPQTPPPPGKFPPRKFRHGKLPAGKIIPRKIAAYEIFFCEFLSVRKICFYWMKFLIINLLICVFYVFVLFFSYGYIFDYNRVFYYNTIHNIVFYMKVFYPCSNRYKIKWN